MSIDIPAEVQLLVDLCKSEMMACEVWLFGSRARGDHIDDSDYDLLAIVPDEAPEDIDSPMAAFRLRRRSGAHADLLTGRYSDFMGSKDVVNTLAYEVAKEGVRLA
ncbi:nucleotidyltransferase domain-containing protein [Sulfitobacter sp. 1A13421]|uniref:nucleotidyltransferase domain-containing protein n=1 Tax=Sulfitobacter sp. 1A13421 TaxID=3368595 RepID=UPI0037462088